MIQYIENNFSFLKQPPAHIKQPEELKRQCEDKIQTTLLNKPLPILNGNDYLCASNIIYVEAISNYSKIYLANGKNITISKTLKKVEQILSEYDFYRIHNSYLLNLHVVDFFKKIEGNKVKLYDGASLEVSRRRRRGFLRMIKLHTLS